MSSGSDERHATYRERLLRFYAKYNEACIPTIDAIMKSYSGRENELIRHLVNKYGPEPDGDGGALSAQAPAPTTTSSDIAKSSGENTVPRFVAELQGRLRRMIARYGLPPAYQSQPPSVDEMPIDEAASLLEHMVLHFGEEPPSTPDGAVDWRSIFAGFMSDRCPSELPKLDALVETFRGRERDVLVALNRRYPRPGEQTDVTDPSTDTYVSTVPPMEDVSRPSPTAPLDSAQQALKLRLEVFYRKYNPAKLSDVDSIARAFGRDPEALMARLKSKYGVPDTTTDEKLEAAESAGAVPDRGLVDHQHPRIVHQEYHQVCAKPLHVGAAADLEFLAPTPSKDNAADNAQTHPAEAAPRPPPERKVPSLLQANAPAPFETLNNEPTTRRVSPPPMSEGLPATADQGQAKRRITPPPAGASMRERLYRFFSFYCPDELCRLGDMLVAHAGREAEWLQTLIEKHGPEPPPRRRQRARTSTDVAFERELTQLFTQFHDEAMLGLVSFLVDDPSLPRKEFLCDAQRAYRSRGGASRFISPNMDDHLWRAQTDVEEEGRRIGVADHGPPPAGPSTVSELEAAVRDLTVALDEKILEVQTLLGRVAQVSEDRGMLETKVNELTVRNRELEDEVCKTRDALASRAVLDTDEAAALRADLKHLAGALHEQTKRTAAATSTVAAREHQNRVLRMQLQQLAEDITQRDEKIKALLQSREALNDSLAERLKDLSALQLDLTPSSDPERFYAIVDDIQAAFKTHYNEHLTTAESEMREYYAYAEKQISNREAIIEELLAALAVGAERHPGHQASEHTAWINSALPQGSLSERKEWYEDERATVHPDTPATTLVEEVARLRTLLRAREAEHTALVQAIALRQNAAQLEPPAHQNHRGSSVLQDASIASTRLAILEDHRAVQTLKQQLQEQKAAAEEKQAAMTAELKQAYHEMAQLHERMLLLEDERAAAERHATALERQLATARASSPTSRVDRSPSYSRQEAVAEQRAQRALEESHSLLEAAGRRLAATEASRSPPNEVSAAAMTLTGTSKHMEDYFAAARGTINAHRESASPPPAAHWHSSVASAPLSQAKTVWELMYGLPRSTPRSAAQ